MEKTELAMGHRGPRETTVMGVRGIVGDAGERSASTRLQAVLWDLTSYTEDRATVFDSLK